jgi:hypothetical protein
MVLTSGLGWAARRHKPIVWPTLPHQLEVDSAGQLHETGAGSARKLSERSVRLRSCCRVELGTRIYARELRVVERVVGFSPALIVTTNLPFSEWTTVFPNPRLCKALLDRVTDRAHIVETGTESFRFRRTMERRKKKP